MGAKTLLLFRHVATLDGAGGRLPVVWDESTSDYKFRHPTKKNPRFFKKHRGIDDDFRKRTPVLTFHGSLDTILSLAQPIAKGPSKEWPEISAAPTATEDERRTLGVN